MMRPQPSFAERAKTCVSTLAKNLFLLMEEKKTNLAFSADVTKADDLLALASLLGPEICVLKTHIDIIDDFTPQLTKELRDIANKNQFMLFEDRKFADIGNTVKHQYGGGIYRIADWADMVNAHVLPGPDIIKGLHEVGFDKNRGLLLLAEMSSKGHLMSKDYIQQTLNMATLFPEFVIGFITQHAVSSDFNWINMTPGIKFRGTSDSLGQGYITPEQAMQQGSDVLIVGRGILNATDKQAEARLYREEGWKHYKKHL